MLRPFLDIQMSFRVAGARDCATCQKVSKTWGFCSSFKNVGRRGTSEEDLQRCILRASCSTRDILIRDVRRSGRRFPERGCTLEHEIFRFAKMILRDRCSTSYDLAALFLWQAQYSRQKNRKTYWYEAVSSALNLPFLGISRNCFVFDVVNFEKWGSQNYFVFDVVKFKVCGSLSELQRFWCCQVQKLRTSRRIASFSSLQIDR